MRKGRSGSLLKHYVHGGVPGGLLWGLMEIPHKAHWRTGRSKLPRDLHEKKKTESSPSRDKMAVPPLDGERGMGLADESCN